jgi:hypothetical protein
MQVLTNLVEFGNYDKFGECRLYTYKICFFCKKKRNYLITNAHVIVGNYIHFTFAKLANVAITHTCAFAKLVTRVNV